MAVCSRCGAETSLFTHGVPFCVKCDDERNEMARDRGPVLLERLRAARAAYRQTLIPADEASKLASDMIGNPDGTFQVRKTQREASAALEQYHKALKDYTSWVRERR
jgi:hypothetical protein